MSFPRYPRYKDSGVEWLGAVPEHWIVKRLKHNLRLLTEKTDRREHVLALENIESWTGRYIATETEFEGEGVAFEAGDILFGKLRPYLAKALLADSAGEAVGDFHVMSPSKGINSRFAQYQILNREFIDIVDGSTFGSKMPRASWEFVGGMAMATPPSSEQDTIAAFLDRETAKIDALVAEQRRLIELLKEKRQAVISHAVTKGLNPDAPMKSSGFDWIGEIPAHWTLPPVYMRYNQVLGKMLDHGKMTGEHPMPYLRNLDVRWDYINVDDLPVMDIAPEERERFTVRKGDLLMVEGRELGRSAIWQGGDDVVAFQKALHRLRPLNATEHTRYFYYMMAFANGTSVFLADQSPNEIPHLTGEELRKYRFPKPPHNEQIAIADYLDRKTQELDLLVAEAQRAIDLLQEHRTALISAAVTGKIDVRGLAAEEEAA